MAQQQVFRLPQRTSIHDLQVFQEDVPSPTSNEVLIKIKSVALNYRDFAVATGKYPFPVKDRVVPGSDLSGEVVSVGSHVDDFSKGDKVVASFDLKTLYGAMPDWHHSLGGCYDGVLREYIALPSSAVVKVSSSTRLDFAQLSALVLGWQMGRVGLWLGSDIIQPNPTQHNPLLACLAWVGLGY